MATKEKTQKKTISNKYEIIKRFPTKDRLYLKGDFIEIDNKKVVDYLRTNKIIK